MEECNWVWKLETGSGLVVCCQKSGWMILAYWLASRPDVFGQILTRPSRSDLGQFCTIWSMSSLKKQNWIGCGELDQAYTTQPDSGCILAIMAITKMLPDWIQHVYWGSSMKPMHQENHASAYQHMVQVEKELLDQIHMIIIMNTKSA